MEFSSSFAMKSVDELSNIPTPHLSQLIKIMFPQVVVGSHRIERHLHKIHKEYSHIYNKPDMTITPVGSSSEGLQLPDMVKRGSPPTTEYWADMDFMWVPKNKLIAASKDSVESEDFIAYMETDGCRDGYSKLVQTHPDLNNKRYKLNSDTEGKFYWNAMALREDILMAAKTSLVGTPLQVEVQGPSIETTDPTRVLLSMVNKVEKVYAFDTVISFPCPQWHPVSNEWRTRESASGWPGQEIKESIVFNGCHVVPVAHRSSTNPAVEWRISFAQSESRLARETLTDSQRQCFLFVKLIFHQKLKHLQVLSSYHLKNLLFFACEMVPKSAWDENIGACAFFILDLLVECVSKRYMPNYFVPQNNMIDHVPEEDLKTLESYLMDLRCDPIKPMLEFTDTRIVYDFCCALYSYRQIVDPILKDMANFRQFGIPLLSAMQAFTASYSSLCILLSLTDKPSLAVGVAIENYQMLRTYGGMHDTTLPSFLLKVASSYCKTDIKMLAAFLEETTRDKEDDQSYTTCFEHLACLYHANAYKFKEGTTERERMFQKSNEVFVALCSKDNVNTATKVDYGWLLLKTKRYEECITLLKDENSSGRGANNWNDYCEWEAVYTCDRIREEINNAPNKCFKAPSIAVAYYILIKCMIGMSGITSDEVAITTVEFEDKCELLVNPCTFSLLGYISMETRQFERAVNAFARAFSIIPNDPLVKKNLDECLNLQSIGEI